MRDRGAGAQAFEGPGGGKDASALIGQLVTWTTKTASVLAESCQGDMDCGKSDQVELVVTLTNAP